MGHRTAWQATARAARGLPRAPPVPGQCGPGPGRPGGSQSRTVFKSRTVSEKFGSNGSKPQRDSVPEKSREPLATVLTL
eukprot:238841-Hanusia_phi.AAC.2